MSYAGSKDDPVDQAIRAVEMAEEIERLKAERDHAYQRAESETLRAETAERALAPRHKPTSRAPEHYNDIRLDPYLSGGVWRYQIVATDYHGNEARINVDPDTLVRFASEALAVALADKASSNGYWTCPWAEQ